MKRFFPYIPLLLIVVLASVVRLVWLGSVPTAINNDQLYYLLNVKSFFLTGTDMSGSVSLIQLLFFNYPLHDLVQAELPFFLAFPFVGPFPVSLFLAILPNVLLSVGIVVILYLLIKELFNKNIALFVALVAAINPWFIFIGRTFYEVVPATFFYLFAIYLLLKLKGWKILWAFPVILLAFYSYIGTKLIFLPFVLITILYCYFFVHKKKYLKQYVVLFGLAIVVVLLYVLQIQSGSDTSRLSEIVTPFHPALKNATDQARITPMQAPFTEIFENKFTLYFRLLSINFFNIFSPIYLFSSGDMFFSLERHGLFYPFDALFLIIGSVWVFLKKKALFIYFLLLILLSTLPQILHDPDGGGNFTPHIALLIPFFIIFIGVGIWQSINFLPRKRYIALIGSLVIGFIYLFSFFNFLHIYFTQLPLRSGLFDFPTRIVSRYIDLAAQDGRQVAVYSPSTPIAFKKYLFYTNSLDDKSVKQVQSMIGKSNFTLENVHFLPCNDPAKTDPTKWIVIHDAICGKKLEKSPIGVPQLKDSGAMYHIYNDTLCRKYTLERFVRDLSVSDLKVESLQSKDFCEKFIIAVE